MTTIWVLSWLIGNINASGTCAQDRGYDCMALNKLPAKSEFASFSECVDFAMPYVRARDGLWFYCEPGEPKR